MRVPYNYLPMEFKNNSEIFKEWKKLIKSTDFTIGKYVERFEKKFSKYIKVKHCISTNNGTDALILSLKSLGVGLNDEVITVCNSFYATAGSIVACGAKPIFVDSDDRYQIDISKLKQSITKKTKVIMPVHWGGASPNMFLIKKIAEENNIDIIEDACMGIGALINKKSPGTFGKVNAFSMHPLKSLNVMGDGGMVVTNDDKLASWIRKYRNHGMIDRDNIAFWGVNMRLQPLQSIVAYKGIQKLDKIIKKRNYNAKILDKGLDILRPKVTIPKRPKKYLETFALYMILCENRNKLLNFLNRNNIEAKIHYPIPLHLQKASKKYGYKKGDFPLAEMQAKKLITLPVHQFLEKKQLNFMIKKIKEFYN